MKSISTISRFFKNLQFFCLAFGVFTTQSLQQLHTFIPISRINTLSTILEEMSYTAQLDAFVSRLNESTDYTAKHAILSELLDTIEQFSGATEYEYFLKNLVPIFLKELEEVPFLTSQQVQNRS